MKSRKPKATRPGTGPGSPYSRFKILMDELETLFPSEDNFISNSLPEQEYIKMIADERKSKETALQNAIDALNTWTATYASELCSDDMVEMAQKRILEHGGTLAYIADVVQQCKSALKDNNEDSNKDG